jgi:hypothetical protein
LRAIAREKGITAANAYLEPLANIEASFPPPTDVKPVRLPVPPSAWHRAHRFRAARRPVNMPPSLPCAPPAMT